ncbi:hypothetical protein KKD04_01875 [Patescibacteria group bacterium]|nr:hypothetical protein [Patescibacteria group bacterium]
MEIINVEKADFNKVLTTVEILISDVEKMLPQDEIVNKRIKDIKTEQIIGKTEEDYNEYLKKRGIVSVKWK